MALIVRETQYTEFRNEEAGGAEERGRADEGYSVRSS